MFVIELTYKAALAEIDAHMAAHVRFSEEVLRRPAISWSPAERSRGMEGSSWRRGKSRQQIEAIIQEDPFHQHGLADFRDHSSSGRASARTTCRNGSMGDAHSEHGTARMGAPISRP